MVCSRADRSSGFFRRYFPGEGTLNNLCALSRSARDSTEISFCSLSYTPCRSVTSLPSFLPLCLGGLSQVFSSRVAPSLDFGIIFKLIDSILLPFSLISLFHAHVFFLFLETSALLFEISPTPLFLGKTRCLILLTHCGSFEKPPAI